MADMKIRMKEWVKCATIRNSTLLGAAPHIFTLYFNKRNKDRWLVTSKDSGIEGIACMKNWTWLPLWHRHDFDTNPNCIVVQKDRRENIREIDAYIQVGCCLFKWTEIRRIETVRDAKLTSLAQR